MNLIKANRDIANPYGGGGAPTVPTCNTGGGNLYRLPSVIQSAALTANVVNLQPSFTGIAEALSGQALANVIIWQPFAAAGNAINANHFAAMAASFAMLIDKVEYFDSLNTSSIALQIFNGNFTGNDQSLLSLTVDAASSTASRTVVSNSTSFIFTANTMMRISVPAGATGATLCLYPRGFVTYNEVSHQ